MNYLLISGNDCVTKGNIIFILLFILKGLRAYNSPLVPNSIGISADQPARRREVTRRSPERQNSKRCGFATGRGSGWALSASFCGLGSRGSDARIISSSPYSSNHAESIASARSSTHSSTRFESCLRLFADLFSCIKWYWCKRVLESSNRYEIGGSTDSSFGGSDAIILDHLSLGTRLHTTAL